MQGYCALLFVMKYGSYGPCENCHQTALTRDCQCPTLVADTHSYDDDCSACGGNMCDWFGTHPTEPIKHRIDRATLRNWGGDITPTTHTKATFSLEAGPIFQPDWMRCPACGKRGNHEHQSTGLSNMLLGDVVDDYKRDTLDDYKRDTLDEVMDEVMSDRAKRKFLMTDYVTDYDYDAIFPGIKATKTKDADSEHEPGNPNCLCLGLGCQDNRGSDV